MIYLLRRFASWYFDVLIVIFISMLFQHLLSKYQLDLSKNNVSPSAEFWVAIQLFTMFFYYLFVELIFKRSIGKMLFKFQTDGFDEKINFNRFFQVLKRTISRFIPFEPFSIFLDEEKMMWHDKFSNTKVIDIRKKR